jgi:hypothetical protein
LYSLEYQLNSAFIGKKIIESRLYGGEKMKINKKILALFLIIVIINLTPAFANQLGDIAKEAEDYNVESQKEMGFFAKISFITKGFKLVDKAEKAQESSKNVKNASEDELDEYETMWNDYKASELQKQHLIAFQKAKSANSEKESSNQNKNNKSTNNTNTTSQTGNNTLNIPDECFTNADMIIAEMNGLILSKNLHKIDRGLMGQMVQLTDEGYLRYAYVKNIELNGTNPHIILITGSGNEITMRLDEFTKQYTGIALNIKGGQNPESILNLILEVENQRLKDLQEKNTELKDQAKNGVLINGLLMGVAIILIIVGILLATIFGKQLMNVMRKGLKQRTFPDGTIFRGCQFADENAYENIMLTQNSMVDLEPLTPDEVLFNMDRMILGAILYKASNAIILELAERGFVITTMSSAELVMYIVAENWIKVILCSVGIILFLCGIALAIYSIIQLFKNGINWWYTSKIIRTTKKDSEALDKWSKAKTIVRNNITNDRKDKFTPMKTDITQANHKNPAI